MSPAAELARLEADYGVGYPALDGPELESARIREADRRSQNPNLDADPVTPEKPRARVYSPKLYSSKEFFSSEFPREFLVRDVLVKGQAGVLGGPKKTLKSGVGIDLAVSLASATPFLGLERFAVPRRMNVLLLNGESGNATVQETGARIARARGIDPETLSITWGEDLPQLANPEHLQDLADLVTSQGIDVVQIDPAYLCLLSGIPADRAQAGNLFDMGPIYSLFAKSMIAAKATPILTVHARKSRGFDPLDLDDLTYAGVAEFARQWILLNRREAYREGGEHKLWLNIGGSAGHFFLGHLDIHEGMIGSQFEGRTWSTAVEGYREAKHEHKADRDRVKEQQNQVDELRIAKMIDSLTSDGEAATLTRLRNGSGLSRARTDSAIERLRQKRLIKPYVAIVPKGNNATQGAEAYRRNPNSV